ncbi:MAG: hypothetical protein QXK00_00085 [archaeon]
MRALYVPYVLLRKYEKATPNQALIPVIGLGILFVVFTISSFLLLSFVQIVSHLPGIKPLD